MGLGIKKNNKNLSIALFYIPVAEIQIQQKETVILMFKVRVADHLCCV